VCHCKASRLQAKELAEAVSWMIMRLPRTFQVPVMTAFSVVASPDLPGRSNLDDYIGEELSGIATLY
jgi:hypothetical protein